jgi:type I restriction enzyme S subunit
MSKWRTVELREVVARAVRPEAPMSGTTYRQIGVKLWGEGAYERETMDGSQTKYAELFRADAGDIIVNKIWARNGSVAVVPQALAGCFGSGEFPMFTPRPGLLESRWMHWLTKTPAFWEQCDVKSQGTSGKNRIKPEQFLSVEIPLPSLAEQRRVVARIEKLASQIHEARTLRHQGAEEAEALFDSALTARFDSSNWPLKPLPEVATVARGKFGHRPRNEPRFYGGDIPFIQIGDISNSNRYIRAHSQTLNESGLAISRMFPIGTVAIAITGATIGVTGILSFASCFPDSIVGIQAKPGVTTPEFIHLAVEHAKKTALAEATQTTQPNINLGNLQRLKVRVPPLPEQRRIVAELDALQAEVDALKRLQAETAAELDALLPAILDRAFKGEL